MKKFFLFAAALMVSMAMMADTETNPTSVTKDVNYEGTSYTFNGTYIAGGGSAKVGDMPNKGVKVRLNRDAVSDASISNALEFTVNEGYQITGITIVGITNSDNKEATVGSIYVDGAAWDGVFDGTLPAKNASAASNIAVTGIAAQQSVIFAFSNLGGATQANITWTVEYETATPSTDPVLNVSTDSIALHATAAYPNPSTTVTFTGKNLTPGTYNLTTPSQMTYWTINPTSVTVGEDGKLNAEITIGYTGNEVVEDEKSSIGLSINGITKNVIIYATSDMQKNFATSVNIEGWVVANGKKTSEFKSVLSAANIEYSKIDELDSLNSTKTKRNEPYLGLKLKTQGAYMACWLQAGHTIRVKFGNVAANVKAYINGAEQTFTPEQLATPLEYTATADTYVKFETTTSGTVVVKQIMIDEPIVDVMYTITYADSEHGTTTGWTIAYPNEKVYVTFAPDENYIVMHCDYNGTEIVGIPQEPEWFIMPAAHVTVTTLYDLPNAIDNTDTAVEATKVIRDGKLFIMKNGVMYDAQGAVVR